MDMERRTSDRLIAKVPTFAVVRPDFSIAGKIVNIHKGGFCFQYIVSDRNLVDAETVGIDLFLDNNKLYLHGISCKKIYDIDAYDSLQRVFQYIDPKHQYFDSLGY